MLEHNSYIKTAPSVLDAFSAVLEKKLQYNRELGERDLVILTHEIGIEDVAGKKKTHFSTLALYGSPDGYSAMAKTVGLPAAIGTELILEGALNKFKGCVAPVHAEIYNPVLERLHGEGIKIVDTVVDRE
jgi:alpha-aminoadipic semialdehyde synthase